MRRNMKFASRDKNAKTRGSKHRLPNGCMKFFRRQQRAAFKAQMERYLQSFDEDILYPVNINEAEDPWGWD